MRRGGWRLCFLTALGCGGPAATVGSAAAPLPVPAGECVLDGGAAPALLRVGVAEPVSFAGAPVPRTVAERFVYRQLYETLVRVDCVGTVLPGMATSWSSEEDGRVWRFRLREGGVFSDGTHFSPVTAGAVAESWSEPARGARVSGVFTSVTAVGERELRVELRAPAARPYLFAHPDLAIARRAASAPWPIGSAAFRIHRSDPPVTSIVTVSARAGIPAAIEFGAVPGADARAALDAGVDLLVAADPAVVAYARALSGYTVTALPWNRTYTLATRARRAAADTVMGPSADALTALARDAVTGGTRPATPPFWWQEPHCLPTVPTVPPGFATPRAGARTIIYPRGDAVARGIAERLAALAWPAARAPAWLRGVLRADYAAAGPPVVAGLDARAVLDSALLGGGLAFVMPLSRSAAAACTVTPLAEASAALVLVGSRDWRFTPLLDAHDYLVHRGNFGRLTVDGDGTLVLGGGGP